MPKQKTALAEVETRNITGMITPAGSIEDTIKQFQLYQELKKRLATKEDFQPIKGKQHPKKSFVRKVQRFFNLSCELLRDEPLRDENGEIIAWVATARAIHVPTGAFQDADGSCSFDEKVKEQRTIHNIRAHAITRAKNRAILDLVGFGDVSAEEIITDEYSGNGQKQANQKSKTSNKAVEYFCSSCGVKVSQKVYEYSVKKMGEALCMDCQKKKKNGNDKKNSKDEDGLNWTAFWAAAKDMGYSKDDVHAEAARLFNVEKVQSLKDYIETQDDLDSLLDHLRFLKEKDNVPF